MAVLAEVGALAGRAADLWCRAYVDRCFALCHSDADRDATEAALKEKIQAAMKSGTLYSHNWTEEPLLRVAKGGGAGTGDGRSASAKNTPNTHTTATVVGKKEMRARRFQAEEPVLSAAAVEEQSKRARKKALLALAEDGVDWDEYTIIGMSQSLEKAYLRLTSVPACAAPRC